MGRWRGLQGQSDRSAVHAPAVASVWQFESANTTSWVTAPFGRGLACWKANRNAPSKLPAGRQARRPRQGPCSVGKARSTHTHLRHDAPSSCCPASARMRSCPLRKTLSPSNTADRVRMWSTQGGREACRHGQGQGCSRSQCHAALPCASSALLCCQHGGREQRGHRLTSMTAALLAGTC